MGQDCCFDIIGLSNCTCTPLGCLSPFSVLLSNDLRFWRMVSARDGAWHVFVGPDQLVLEAFSKFGTHCNILCYLSLNLMEYLKESPLDVVTLSEHRFSGLGNRFLRLGVLTWITSLPSHHSILSRWSMLHHSYTYGRSALRHRRILIATKGNILSFDVSVGAAGHLEEHKMTVRQLVH